MYRRGALSRRAGSVRGAVGGVSPWWRSPIEIIVRTSVGGRLTQASAVRGDAIHAGATPMKHRLAVAAIAALALVVFACADDRTLTTESRGGAISYVSTGSAAYVNPKTHRLESMTPERAASNGLSASIVASSSSPSLLQVESYEPGVAPSTSIGGHATFSFTDNAMHKQTIVLLYRSAGGPPAAMQHYTDGALVSTTSYLWGRTSTGWVRTQSVMRSVQKGVLVGSYTTTATYSPLTPPSGGTQEMLRLTPAPEVSPLQRVLGAVGYGLAFAFAPQDATAQFYFGPCRQEWLKYAGAAAILSGAAVALSAAPELTPLLLTTFIGALAATAAAEDLLVDCMIRNDSVASGGFTGSGGGGGGSGTASDCLQGAYENQCIIAFVL
jgi:hypothetical protein